MKLIKFFDCFFLFFFINLLQKHRHIFGKKISNLLKMKVYKEESNSSCANSTSEFEPQLQLMIS